MRIVYTDGSCLGNPGPGGRAAIIKHTPQSKKLKADQYSTLTGGEMLTTNNQMELQAVIEALERILEEEKVQEAKDTQEEGNHMQEAVQALPGGIGLFAAEPGEQLEGEVHIRTDSNYVKLGVTQRLATRKQRQRRRAKGGKLIENLDRWQRLDWLLSQFVHIHRHRVKGHAGDAMNEQVDRLARYEAEKRMKR